MENGTPFTSRFVASRRFASSSRTPGFSDSVCVSQVYDTISSAEIHTELSSARSSTRG